MEQLKTIFFINLFLASLVAGTAQAEKLDVEWKNGLRFSGENFKLKLGGRIMHDWFFSSADSNLESENAKWEDGSEFRRARLYFAGTIYKNVAFKAQYDFAGGDADIKDMYIAIKKLPVIGTLKAGHFKEPFGLEELTSSKYITFMERSMAMEAFAPSRNSGFMIANSAWDKRLVWALGVFKDTNGYGEEYGDNEFNITGRVAAAVWKQDKDLLHLGISYSGRKPNANTTRFRTRPEAHLAPARLVDTGKIASDKVNLIGLEAATVLGSFSVQGEYVVADVNGTDGSDAPTFSSYYVYASYFLTGESRAYKKGKFGRVKPHANYGAGSGAVEVAVRYSSIDLNNGDVRGGEEDNYTIGLNWYLNPSTRVMLNYLNADRADLGVADITQMRFQIDF